MKSESAEVPPATEEASDLPPLSTDNEPLSPSKLSANTGLNRKYLKALACSYCGKQFVSRRELLVHQWSHKERQAYECGICEKSFNREQLFRKHMASHVKNESRLSHCDICGKAFRTGRLLEQHHLKSHAGEKPFKCATCGISFSWRTNLTKHEHIHVEKPFACLICHEAFRDSQTLDRHLRMHKVTEQSDANNGEGMDGQGHKDNAAEFKPFQCTICQQEFKYKFTLEAHMKGHDDPKSKADEPGGVTSMLQKPHQCEKCGESFRWEFCLDAHVKIHSQQQRKDGVVFYQGVKVPKPVSLKKNGVTYRPKYLPDALQRVPASKSLNNTKVYNVSVERAKKTVVTSADGSKVTVQVITTTRPPNSSTKTMTGKAITLVSKPTPTVSKAVLRPSPAVAASARQALQAAVSSAAVSQTETAAVPATTAPTATQMVGQALSMVASTGITMATASTTSSLMTASLPSPLVTSSIVSCPSSTLVASSTMSNAVLCQSDIAQCSMLLNSTTSIDPCQTAEFQPSISYFTSDIQNLISQDGGQSDAHHLQTAASKQEIQTIVEQLKMVDPSTPVSLGEPEPVSPVLVGTQVTTSGTEATAAMTMASDTSRLMLLGQDSSQVLLGQQDHGNHMLLVQQSASPDVLLAQSESQMLLGQQGQAGHLLLGHQDQASGLLFSQAGQAGHLLLGQPSQAAGMLLPPGAQPNSVLLSQPSQTNAMMLGQQSQAGSLQDQATTMLLTSQQQPHHAGQMMLSQHQSSQMLLSDQSQQQSSAMMLNQQQAQEMLLQHSHPSSGDMMLAQQQQNQLLLTHEDQHLLLNPAHSTTQLLLHQPHQNGAVLMQQNGAAGLMASQDQASPNVADATQPMGTSHADSPGMSCVPTASHALLPVSSSHPLLSVSSSHTLLPVSSSHALLSVSSSHPLLSVSSSHALLPISHALCVTTASSEASLSQPVMSNAMLLDQSTDPTGLLLLDHEASSSQPSMESVDDNGQAALDGDLASNVAETHNLVQMLQNMQPPASMTAHMEPPVSMAAHMEPFMDQTDQQFQQQPPEQMEDNPPSPPAINEQSLLVETENISRHTFETVDMAALDSVTKDRCSSEPLMEQDLNIAPVTPVSDICMEAKSTDLIIDTSTADTTDSHKPAVLSSPNKKKKARMIRVEQVEGEGRKKGTKVTDLNQDVEEKTKKKRGRPKKSESHGEEIDRAQEKDVLPEKGKNGGQKDESHDVIEKSKVSDKMSEKVLKRVESRKGKSRGQDKGRERELKSRLVEDEMVTTKPDQVPEKEDRKQVPGELPLDRVKRSGDGKKKGKERLRKLGSNKQEKGKSKGKGKGVAKVQKTSSRGEAESSQNEPDQTVNCGMSEEPPLPEPEVSSLQSEVSVTKRKRGRPRRGQDAAPEESRPPESDPVEEAPPAKKKRRGRSKTAAKSLSEEDTAHPPVVKSTEQSEEKLKLEQTVPDPVHSDDFEGDLDMTLNANLTAADLDISKDTATQGLSHALDHKSSILDIAVGLGDDMKYVREVKKAKSKRSTAGSTDVSATQDADVPLPQDTGRRRSTRASNKQKDDKKSSRRSSRTKSKKSLDMETLGDNDVFEAMTDERAGNAGADGVTSPAYSAHNDYVHEAAAAPQPRDAPAELPLSPSAIHGAEVGPRSPVHIWDDTSSLKPLNEDSCDTVSTQDTSEPTGTPNASGPRLSFTLYTCEVCNKAFTRRAALVAHKFCRHSQRRHYLEPEAIALRMAWRLRKRYMAMLLRSKPFSCIECHKKFMHHGYLTFHEEGHDNITRTYYCHHCDLTMTSWLQCINHQMNHRRGLL